MKSPLSVTSIGILCLVLLCFAGVPGPDPVIGQEEPAPEGTRPEEPAPEGTQPEPAPEEPAPEDPSPGETPPEEPEEPAPDPDDPAVYTEEATAIVEAASEWLLRQAIPIKRGKGVQFPEYAESPEDIKPSIYNGSAGVLIFLENAAKFLDSKQLRRAADATFEGLLVTAERAGRAITWRKETDRRYSPGALYTGDAGVAYAMLVRDRLRDDRRARRMALEIGRGLAATAAWKDGGASWSKTLDIIEGSAGTVLVLLELAEEYENKSLNDAAIAGARWLARQGVEEKSSLEEDAVTLWWPPEAGQELHYPNFSHGTAGVVFALARVSAATGDDECGRAALAGAAWLLENAKLDEETVCWAHFIPGRGEDSYQEGWCHGPAGTVRTMLLLHSVTDEDVYLELAKKSANFIMKKREDPSAESARFYSPSLCCGSAGIIDMLLDMHDATGDEKYVKYARLVARNLRSLAKEDGDGLKWTNYNRPDDKGLIYHGTSFMLGTSGEAFSFLRLAALERPEFPLVHLPDHGRPRTARLPVAREPKLPPLPEEEAGPEKTD